MEYKEVKNKCEAYFDKIKNVAKFKMKLKETMNLLDDKLNKNSNNYATNFHNDNLKEINIDVYFS